MEREIKERERAENEVKKLNEDLERRVADRTLELEAANKDLEAFSYSVAHDLRAPLRHIDAFAFAKILEEDYGGKLDGEGLRFLGLVQSRARDMGHLVDDLLNLSRVGRQDLLSSRADLKDLVESIRNDLKPECASRSVEWRIGPLPCLECDAELLKQVFANLLSNAVKYTRMRQGRHRRSANQVTRASARSSYGITEWDST